ncbi:MAG: bifunctional alpha,alpha-trehalose-phosphate synthase (UDP-forming)/trehalose-phosphatase [Bacteroidota bacterium]|nr:bifunctional alpha,alpha-trehalose-phosphate synthase (UDP-forming)/trehalose-phosphatase [Bacteroidota bacterium]
MVKNVIVSNRLPIQLTKLENSFDITSSSGGLATGVNSIRDDNSVWIGWSGVKSDEFTTKSNNHIKKILKEQNLIQVELSSIEIENYYYGLSNKSLWPLFHYFIDYSKFNDNHWDTYFKVNKKFCDAVVSNVEKNGTVWVHDYQLMLLPKMIRDLRPDLSIGFFLHIPFPSYEIFRIFPRRKELLEGILGADLVGFHTYNYERHFLSSIKRILRKEVNFNRISHDSREIAVNTFPMGIDYEKFHNAAKTHERLKKSQESNLKKQLDLHKKSSQKGKLILSIDRLDYTKGIINRVKAFEIFLEKYPQYLGKVRLVMLTVPSRSDVSDYKNLKKETDELVGRINGKFATVNWTPIWYYYRAMNFDDLIDLYMNSDIAMITPLRDGMNLVAKEFVSTRVNLDGVLILSEMAGASIELFDSILVNPFDLDQMSESILKALEMPAREQKRRMLTMQKRLSRYTVQRWAKDFINSLSKKSSINLEKETIEINKTIEKTIYKKFKKSFKKVLFLDYDGTLVKFNNDPELAVPNKNLLKLLKSINLKDKTEVFIVSGRDQFFLDKWFGKLNINLVAEHGNFIKYSDSSKWFSKNNDDLEWKNDVSPIFESFTDNTPGTFIENKKNTLVWHYRKTDPELAKRRIMELKTVLSSLISENISVIDGNKALEVTNLSINKGNIINELLSNENYDFIFCCGDDASDEYMFNALPENSISIKVGEKNTLAKYFVKNSDKIKSILSNFN